MARLPVGLEFFPGLPPPPHSVRETRIYMPWNKSCYIWVLWHLITSGPIQLYSSGPMIQSLLVWWVSIVFSGDIQIRSKLGAAQCWYIQGWSEYSVGQEYCFYTLTNDQCSRGQHWDWHLHLQINPQHHLLLKHQFWFEYIWQQQEQAPDAGVQAHRVNMNNEVNQCSVTMTFRLSRL